MTHIVKCRVCKQQFDTGKMSEDEWIMPSRNFYYHTKCYNDWRENRNNAKASNRSESFWYESLIDYLYRDIKMEINFPKVNHQWNMFVSKNKGYTPKGVYFAIRYYYDILKGKPEKAQGGIGIVNNVYADAAQYWTELETKKAGTMEAIIEQIKSRDARPIQKITKKETPKKDKSKWSLDDI